MGGNDYYEIDRITGAAGIANDPEFTTMAVQSDQLTIPTVRYLTGAAGIRQFLTIGSGLPDTQEVAQSVAPESTVVYIDNDPMVLMQSRVLLSNTTPRGASAYIGADFTDPGRIVTAAGAVSDFEQPLGILFLGVAGHAESYPELVRIVGTIMDAAPSGSYLTLLVGTDDSPEFGTLCTNCAGTGGAPHIPRPKEQVRGVFDGFTLVEPGSVSITQWRANGAEASLTRPISAYGPVARKP